MPALYEIDMYLHTDIDTSSKYEELKDEYMFGIVQLKTFQKTATTKPVAVFFSVDDSGSMSDLCSDGRTKMQHITPLKIYNGTANAVPLEIQGQPLPINELNGTPPLEACPISNLHRRKHTLTQILQMFSRHTGGGNISVAIESFDSDVKPLFDFVKVTPENVEELIQKVANLFPCDMKNLESALISAKEKIESYHSEHPDCKMVHIQLTDGSSDCEGLKTLVSPDYSNIFLGFGLDHDMVLLQTLASGKWDEYRVIDQLEKGGFVYEEVVHNLLYPAIQNVVFSAKSEGVELYDYRTNRWVKELPIASISGVCEKNFHFRVAPSCSDIPPEILFQCERVDKKGTTVTEELDVIPDLMTELEEGVRYIHTTDLTKYMFRQKTQELLYECKEFIPTNRFNHFMQRVDYCRDEEETEKSELKRNLHRRLKGLYRTLQKYILDLDLCTKRTMSPVVSSHTIMESEKGNIREGNAFEMCDGVKTDIFIRELLDDIYIVYRALGKDASITSARETSQGRGDSYGVNATTVTSLRGEGHPSRKIPEEKDDDDTFLDHMENTSTQEQMTQIMRECSQ